LLEGAPAGLRPAIQRTEVEGRHLGLELDGSGFGLGARSQRYAAIINNGVIERLDVEEGAGITVSSCDAIISHL